MKKILLATLFGLLLQSAANSQTPVAIPSAVLAPDFMQTFSDSSGRPLSGGLICTLVAGTTSGGSGQCLMGQLKATFTDSTAGVTNQNPIVLNSAGQASIWLSSGGYKFVVMNSSGAVQRVVDNVQDFSFSLLKGIAAAGTDSVISHVATGTGVVTRSVRDKLNESISVKDFGAIGDGASHPVSEWCSYSGGSRYVAASAGACLTAVQADYPNITAVTQEKDLAAFQAAVAAASAGSTLYVPAGSYLANATLSKAITLYLDQASMTSGEVFTVAITASSASILCDSHASHLINTRRANVAIWGMNPTGNVVTVAAGLTGVSIKGCSIDPPAKAYFNQPVDEAAYNLGNAIYVGGDESSRVTDLTVEGNLIGSANNGLILDNADYSRVANNYFKNTNVGLTQVGLFGANQTTVIGNTFTDTGGFADAVYVRRSSYGSTSMLQDGNSITGNVATGIYAFEVLNVVNATHNTVSGNTINITTTANNSTGISVWCGSAVAVTCIGNTVSANAISIAAPGGTSGGVCGIGIGTDAYATISGTVVTGNSVYAPATAVSVSGTAYRTQITGNLIVQVAGSASGTGITIGTATDTQVIGNTIVGATTHGIYSSGGVRDMVAWNRVRDSGGCGIRAESGQDSSYSYNGLFTNLYGICFSTASTNIISRGNQYASNKSGDSAGLTVANTGIHEETPMRFDDGLGVGVQPLHPIHIKGQFAGGDPAVYAENDAFNSFAMRTAAAGGGSNTSSSYSGQASAGTVASPTIVATGSELVRLEGRGYDGSAMQIAGQAGIWVDGTPGAGEVPGRFEVILKDEGGSYERKFRVLNDGTILLGPTAALKLFYGAGDPENVVTATVGSLFLRTDGSTSTTLYVKTAGTGNTGWTAK